jgi:hypothetical protein
MAAPMRAAKCLDLSYSNNRQLPPTHPLSCHGVPDLIQIAMDLFLGPFPGAICWRAAMGPINDGRTADGVRCAWEAPTVTQLVIGTETKSAHQADGSPALPEPSPPTPPATKLGFSFEMALPLAARTET